MNEAYISAFAAHAGSAVGALASVATTWLTLNAQGRARRADQAMSRKGTLYGQFIDEASKLLTDALVRALGDPSKLVHLYEVVNKLRLLASPNVLAMADDVMRQIVETYESREKDFHAAVTKGRDFDVRRPFSEACRADLAYGTRDDLVRQLR
jgi:hypothetical protein